MASYYCVEHTFLWPDGKIQSRSYDSDDVGSVAKKITDCINYPGTTKVVLAARTTPKRRTSLRAWTFSPQTMKDDDRRLLAAPKIVVSPDEIPRRPSEHPGPAGTIPGIQTQQVLFRWQTI